ncbi:MAG: hypothetical protein IBX72_16310 [Nitrospirae bacterium]|nr:hypothetical protein [Nitrospirota bacterium]
MGSFFFGAGEINADSLYLKIIRSFIIKINKACWACHGNGSKLQGHPEEYKSPRLCALCHSFGNAYNATRVSGHTKAGIYQNTQRQE